MFLFLEMQCMLRSPQRPTQLLLGGIQAVALPRTTILLLLFLTAFIWIAVILMLLLAVRY